MHRVTFHRSSTLAFPKTVEYSNAVERHEGPSVFASAWFWIGGLLSVCAWTVIWYGIATLLEAMK